MFNVTRPNGELAFQDLGNLEQDYNNHSRDLYKFLINHPCK